MNHKAGMKYAVVGAGCGGQTMAGHLSSMGYDVSLYNRPGSRITSLANKGQIRLKNTLNGTGKPSYIGSDMGRAVVGRDIIMVVTTANGHRDIAESMAPYLEDGQIIMLNPGRTCGALEFQHTLDKEGCSADVIVAEANTLLYATRVETPGVARVLGVKRHVSASALRKYQTEKVISAVSKAYPQFTAADSFLETSLGNIGAVFHPTIMVMNRDRIVKGDAFEFYRDGVNDETAELIEAVDSELMDVARALDAQALSVADWLNSRYGIKHNDVGKMIKSNPAYEDVGAPDTLDHRYLWEDIPTGLVPISEFGRCLNVSTPSVDCIIDEGSNILDRDFRGEGRTPESLGLSRYSLKDDLMRVMEPEKESVGI